MLKRIAIGIVILAAMCSMCGCGGLGGQGFSVRITASDGSSIESVNIDFNADDGGTDLGGLWYKAKEPTVEATVIDTTTRPVQVE